MLDAHRPFRNFVYTVNGTGSPTYVQTSGKPFYDTNGNFLGYLARKPTGERASGASSALGQTEKNSV
jgi:hypothetical protein